MSIYIHKCHRFKNTKRSNGVALMDVVVGVALFLIVVVSLIGVFRLALAVIGESKIKIGALALANERIEFIRSLDYESVGIDGGAPDGILSSSEDVILNGIPYTRVTNIVYFDDDKDGAAGDDADGDINDYKKIRVEVSWTYRGLSKQLFVSTNISE